ncbi:hypothetical protein CG51_10885 [Haematobacter missouriensis]|nr:hypothetical protein CG51_10885 [Haematobacter missouriensis]
MDEGVLNVLREEAAREAEVRRGPNRDSEARATQAAERPPEPTPADPPIAPAIGRLPDVDQPQDIPLREPTLPAPAKSAQPVASPARPRNWEPAPGPVDMPVNQALENFVNEEESERGRRRFNIGFVCGLLLIACLVALYIVGPGLAVDMPGLAPYITTYVENVNAARIWLRDLATPLLGAMQG